MGMEVGELFFAMSLDIAGLRRQLDQAKTEAQRGGSQIAGAFERAAPGSKALLAGVGGLVAGFAVAGGAGLKLAGDMEQTEIAFDTMLGSAEAADEMVEDLWDFAARTPFEFAGLADSTRKLLAYGFAGKDIIPTMTAIGNAVSALGGGTVEIDRVTRAIGQMQAKGKVSAEEMMQLAELGIPAWEILADAIGVSVPRAMEMATKGAISAETGIDAILGGMEERFAGSMDRQSKSLLGLFSTARDEVKGILLGLGQRIIDTFDLKTKLAGAITWLGDLRKALREGGLQGAFERIFPPETHGTIMLIAGAIGGALAVAFAHLAIGVWMALAPLLPFMAIGAAVAGLAYLIYSNWEAVGPLLVGVWEWIKRTALDVWETLEAELGPTVDAIVSAIKDSLEALREFWAQWGDDILRVVRWVWDQVRFVVGTALKLLKDVFGLVLAVLRGDWKDAWEHIKGIATTAWQAIVHIVETAGQLVLGAVKALGKWLWEAAVDMWQRFTAPFRLAIQVLQTGWQTFSDWFGAWWSRLVDTVEYYVDLVLAPIRTIIDWVRKALDWLDNLFSAAGSAEAPSGEFGYPKPGIEVRGFASGGVAVRPTPGWFAEEEPEAVIPLSRLPEVMASLGGGATGGPVTVIVQLDGRTIARASLPHLRREMVFRAGLA